ncbi:hypothetical protein HN51_035818 [Arachis hypogaea]|uniref:Transcription repressor n=1 Tax=Arachis hypogaea TaxID=3818 RepID=A0A445A2U3_ARAHY|nr:transcription repressor OFP8 [Arachis ipaensis]XP_025644189.1 transcription repressor OFP8 [Arachis hypogaea]QHO01013.1 Transcription repressor [Arachis hypogaea]RYR20764.1 hypothetical protein Ahy_B03g065997 [Arachis hypogaea]
MENRLKMRISRMFRSSFGSCRNRNITDVMEKAVFTPPPNHHGGFHHLIMIEPPPPPPSRPRPFPSICKPKSSQTFKTVDDNCILSFKDSLPRRTRVSELSSPFAVDGGGFCPPAAPNTPLNTIYEHEKTKNKNSSSARDFKNKKKKKKNKKKMVNAHKKRDMFPFNSCAKDTNFGGYWWYSSDEDDETDTLFSSKSLSSDSSRSRRRHRSRRKNRGGGRSSDTGVMPLQGKVKDTFAVVKRSSDPYSDFRTSMVEMIVEKQIFSPNGLENLLQCFLSLNSYHHHNLIVEVFTEIWEALFSDWF